MTERREPSSGKTVPGGGAAVDVVVAGGGLAGLAGALTLARARRSVLVVDAGHPRNAPAAHAHGYLSRDGVPPLELLAAGRSEVSGYGGKIIAGTVTAVTRPPGGGLAVTLADGTGWQARRVLVATGLVDDYPDIPGLRERWGRDVVHCPFCFGWELRDAPLGVLATGAQATAQALMWRQWSADVALFLHTAPRPGAEQAEQLAARGIAVVEGEVTGIQVTGDRLSAVRLSSGQVVPRRALVIGPRFEARHALLDGLGVTVAEHPLGIGHQVRADATGLTTAAGMWVAGNAADVTAGVMQAAASGVTAAAAINADLTAEDTAAAVAAWRAARRAGAAARLWLAIVGASSRAKEPAAAMRVLTWNLWWRYGPWQQRQQAIASALAQADPDVCGLQEVWGGPDGNLAADLAERLGMHWCWAEAAKAHDGAELFIGNAILSRWPISAHAQAALPVGGLADEARVAVHARIDTPGGALPMFTTHLTYRPGLSQVRIAQVRRLAEFVAEHAAGCVYPPVVTGDLNAEPGSDELRLLGGMLTAPAVPGLVLVDCWRYADPGDPGFTWDHRNGYQAGSQIPDSRIDYILAGLPRQGRGKVESVRLAGHAPVDGVWPSDHFAVVADLRP